MSGPTTQSLDSIIKKRAREELQSRVHEIFIKLFNIMTGDTKYIKVMFGVPGEKPEEVYIETVLLKFEEKIYRDLVPETERLAIVKFLNDHEKMVKEIEQLQNQG